MVQDLFWSLAELDFDTGILAISDKDDQKNFKSRIVWLPELCQKQIVEFNNHRKKVLEQLIILNPLLQTQLQLDYEDIFIWPNSKAAKEQTAKRLPFFFFLQDSGNETIKINVKPTSLHQEIRWAYDLPDNANRHYLRTKLREYNVSGTFVDAFMGHWSIGQEPFGEYSGLSPQLFSKKVKGALTTISEENRWRVING